MTQKQNDRARNQEFSRKREIYRGTDDDPPVLAITRDVVDANAWRAADIRAREAKLLGLMRDIWGIDVAGMQRRLPRSDVASTVLPAASLEAQPLVSSPFSALSMSARVSFTP